MTDYLEKACEEIDAGIFSGDLLCLKEDRELLIKYITRWKKELKESADSISINEIDT